MTDDQPNLVVQAARSVASRLLTIPPGSLAELRRLTDGSPAGEYWRLFVKHPETIGHSNLNIQASWMAIIRCLAILSDKGEPSSRSPLRSDKRHLGAVLCDGGDERWDAGGSGPQPLISQRRFSQLLAARGQQRVILLERAIRAVARNRSRGSGVNVEDIAYTILNRDPVRQNRFLAKQYYDRLARSERKAADQESP